MVLQRFRNETDGKGKEGEIIFRKNVEKYLDKGYGKCFLKDPAIAQLVADSLKYHDDSKYDLSAWVIMPNHIHFLATPLEGVELSEIAHSIKSRIRLTKRTRC